MTMNKISPDDPRLTAYALGEMDGDERRIFEALLAEDPAARAEVEAIRTFSGVLETELAAEPASAVSTNPSPIVEYPTEKKRRAVARYYVWSGLAMAAGLILVFGLNEYLDSGFGMSKATALKVAKQEAMKRAKDDSERRLAERAAVTRDEGAVNAPASAGYNSLGKAEVNGDSPATQTVYMPSSVPVPVGAVPYANAKRIAAKASKRQVEFKTKESANVIEERSQALETRNEGYDRLLESGYSLVQATPLSTFSIDVDTAGYSNVRRFLMAGQLPPAEAVRVEEMVNYFSYHYSPPEQKGEAPVNATLEVATCPWNAAHRLVRIGLKAKEIAAQDRPAANLVLLLDTSGSMDEPNKLPLVKQAVRLLADGLRPQDHLSIVTYAGSSGLALPATDGAHKQDIYDAIENLSPGGSTYGSMGIQLAYDIAKANFVTGGVNRVILCTDGDFNVGVTSQTALQKLIEAKAKSGVFLSVLGFGMGNLKDSTLEMLADKGNGNYGYVDTLQEAKKLFVEQAGGTLVTVAKDVKVQVEFNPSKVSSYRLVGYENRRLAAEDFNNDKIDAGEMGAGHTVTALYEVIPAGAPLETPGVDALKYHAPSAAPATETRDELLTVKVRYKPVDREESRKLEFPLRDSGTSFEAASGDFKFASAVAAFGQQLSGSKFAGSSSFARIQLWVEDSGQKEADSYRKEFLTLVRAAQQVSENVR